MRMVRAHSPLYVLAFVLLVSSGCESFHNTIFTGPLGSSRTSSSEEQEESQRVLYQTQRDPAALKWLLAHRLQTGMSLQEVERILGEDGVRESNDLWIKTNGGHYRSGDVVYQWGPDSEGKRVYLGFRENALVNFDPQEYTE